MSFCGDEEEPRLRPKRRKPSILVTCLLSCVCILVIVCACLIAVLVLVGRHILYNTPSLPKPGLPTRNHVPSVASFKRLPNDTRPILYDLTLHPDLIRGLYKGSVNITIEVDNLRKDLVVHSQNLTVTEIALTNFQGQELQILNVKEIVEDQVIVITTKQRVLRGVYHLFIKFDGRMFDKLVGFYRSQYIKTNGELRQIATSKFEPTYARQAFPCFDEPNLKAKYKVHLLKPKDNNYIALSNYPVSNTADYDDNHQLVSFDETVSMSTYLSCFIVSDFINTETSFENDGSTIPLKVYASPDNLNKTTYAGEVGKKVIEYYIKYFNIPYPLPKLDMVAIPDFVSGAMEHWGLVTYRETALLYSNTTHSSANKQRVATVVAHELAHSWFGNLVTMDWWNDLWLNEGFASYIEYKGVQAAEPTWGMLDQFLTGDLHSVLNLDATLSSHPIVQTVLTPDQITEIFDTISYNKGAAVLRMLEATVGEENFQKGVTNYLNKYAYSNAVTKDFLNEIQEVVGNTLDIFQMMDTFTIQMGYPVLTATVSADEYTLTQKRFLKDSTASYNESESAYKYRWTIPVTYVTDLGKSNDLILFKYDADKITVKKPSGAKWIKFNYDQVGYYRVNYPVDQWRTLVANYPSLNISDRTHLFEETFSIAEAGLLNYTIPLDLTKNLTNERDYLPWSVAYTKLMVIVNYLRSSKSAQEAGFKNYISKIVTPAYKDLTWTESESDGHLERLTRIEVLNLACAVNQEECLSEAQNQFNNWFITRGSLSQDLRGLVYKYGMRKANDSTWESLLEVYKAENDASEKLKLVNGLAYVNNETLLNRLIDLAKDESVVRGQDYFSVMQYIALNPTGTDLVWNWVRDNWEYLVNRFTLNDRYLGALIPAITARFATEDRLTEIKEFFAKYPDAGAGKANRAKALETVQNNIRWLNNYKSSVENWILGNAT